MLWPYTLKATEGRHNKFHVNSKGISPEEQFSNEKVIWHIEDKHAWGCPAFVLDGRLQDRAGGMPKWDPRAQLGINLGRSSSQAGNVHRILNPRTGHVYSQFHVVFDDTFSTVPHLRNRTEPPFWHDLIEASRE
eukprot:9152329-Ditylum_brightwellii.AAC.1